MHHKITSIQSGTIDTSYIIDCILFQVAPCPLVPTPVIPPLGVPPPRPPPSAWAPSTSLVTFIRPSQLNPTVSFLHQAAAPATQARWETTPGDTEEGREPSEHDNTTLRNTLHHLVRKRLMYQKYNFTSIFKFSLLLPIVI